MITYSSDKMTLVKISKQQARKLHAKGVQVYCLPSNAHPLSTWWYPTPAIPADIDFDKFCNEFQYYNCNPETGKQLSFYKEI